MTTRTTLLDEALEAWKFARDGVVDELRNLPDKDLSFRPAPESARLWSSSSTSSSRAS